MSPSIRLDRFHPSALPRDARALRICALALPLALLALAACSNGGSGGSAAAGAGTGSVGVLLTDGPTNDFCAIPVTISEVLLLSDSGQISVFQGTKTVDLLKLRNNTELFTVGSEVPAGRYSKIRLVVSAVQLAETCDDAGNPLDPVIDVAVPSKKIDLNPRGGFEVRGGELLLIQLDMDAEKSIHIHQTGSGKYQFRPVIFVDTFTGALPDRLVLLSGEVNALDLATGSFDLCHTHPVSRPDDVEDGMRMTSMPDEMGDDDPETDTDGGSDACVAITTQDGDNPTSVFDEFVMPASLDVLMNGDAASVLGRFVRDGEQLHVVAEVVQQGEPGTVEAFKGTVLSPVDGAGFFDFALDPEQGFTQGSEIPVLVQDGTKVFSSSGDPLAEGDIGSEPGQRARVVGAVDVMHAQLNSTVIFLGAAADSPDRATGTFSAWNAATRELTLTADSEVACAHVPEDAKVYRAMFVGESIDFEPVDDPSAFLPGNQVDLFGTAGSPCFEARTVIGFDGFGD
jgi:Domain of unknown function (DUF4382)